MSERHLSGVPGRPVPNVYGQIDFFDGASTHRLTIGVYYGGPLASYTDDIVIARSGRIMRHPFDHPRDSTEEERAAVGWTW